MKKYLKILLIAVAVIVVSGCEPRERLYDNITNYTWVGDLGFSDRYGDLESGITLTRNGFGIDAQYYYPPAPISKEPIYILPIRWDLSGDNLSLDYGNNYPYLEIRGMYIIGNTLSGTLYVDGRMSSIVSLRR